MSIIESQDMEAIRKLENGELEEVLNNILRYEVKMPHLEVLNRILGSYWYTTMKDLDINDIQDKIKLMKWFQSEIETQRELNEKRSDTINQPAGSYLFDIIESFVDKFIKNKVVSNKNEAFDLLSQIVDLAKDDLNSVEKRSSTAVITYLRAKKMIKD